MGYSEYDYAVIGGDLRQVYLVEELARHEKRVIHYALMRHPDEQRYFPLITEAKSLEEAISSAQAIICPIPFIRNGNHINQSAFKDPITVHTLVQCLSEGQIFFAGVIPEAFKLAAQERRTTTYDLMVDHTLTVYNTIATAEGAICEAILRCPRNLHHSQCAVLGYGRCGKTLVSTLKGLSCIVSAYTDNPDKLAYAQVAADTAGTLDDFRANAGSFDLIFNTIPAMVIDESVLSTLNPNVTIIDIASAPGGVAFEAATEKRITAALCLGLPGKYAPASSATAIFECVERIVNSQPSHLKE